MGFAKTALNVVRRVAPENEFGDKIFGFMLFVAKHKRLPSRERRVFNDCLYALKTSKEIVDPLRIFISDKEYLKLYVKATVGDAFNVPTIGIVRSVEELHEFSFPRTCCIKPTHASGLVILRRNDEPIDRAEIVRWFSINYYRVYRERNYKYLKPKIVIEELLFGGDVVLDYKIFCFNGDPRLIQVDVDRYGHHKRKLFTIAWDEVPCSMLYERSLEPLGMPANLDTMLDLARKLSAGFSVIRIDMYSDGKSCFVGEITNCHGNASEVFIPRHYEKIVSDIIFRSPDSPH